MHNGTESASVYFFFFLHDVPEFELAAYLPVFNLDELIVAGCHAAVLRKPLEANASLSGIWRRNTSKKLQ